MNTQEIIVSIVMPTFNRASMIGRAIESVMNQNYKYWELLIIDNESTDETVNVVKQYSKDDYRVKYHSVKKSPNKGLSDYLNYGIQNSRELILPDLTMMMNGVIKINLKNKLRSLKIIAIIIWWVEALSWSIQKEKSYISFLKGKLMLKYVIVHCMLVHFGIAQFYFVKML